MAPVFGKAGKDYFAFIPKRRRIFSIKDIKQKEEQLGLSLKPSNEEINGMNLF